MNQSELIITPPDNLVNNSKELADILYRISDTICSHCKCDHDNEVHQCQGYAAYFTTECQLLDITKGPLSHAHQSPNVIELNFPFYGDAQDIEKMITDHHEAKAEVYYDRDDV